MRTLMHVQPSYADFSMANVLDFSCSMPNSEALTGAVPKELMDLKKRVEELPGVKEWIAKRPKSVY